MTEITFKNENGEYTIRVPQEGMTLNSVFEYIIEPVLLAAGYSKELIDEYISE